MPGARRQYRVLPAPEVAPVGSAHGSLDRARVLHDDVDRAALENVNRLARVERDTQVDRLACGHRLRDILVEEDTQCQFRPG